MIEGIRLCAQLCPVWEKVSPALGKKIQDLHVLQKIRIYKKNIQGTEKNLNIYGEHLLN